MIFLKFTINFQSLQPLKIIFKLEQKIFKLQIGWKGKL